MSRLPLCPAVAVALALVAARPAAAAPPSAADKALLKKVADRLLDVAEPVPEFAWPPEITLEDKDSINAYAKIEGRKDGKPQPVVRVHTGMMARVVERNPDRLALIVGHELGHVLHKHILGDERRERTPFLHNTFTRDQEVEADRTGVELMLKAGFSFRQGVRAIKKMQDLGLEYSSFEGLGSDHPSWNDRMARVDKEQARYWKAMGAFSNGVWLLTAEQYDRADLCFDAVTREFPDCYEAWVNLGFARLMRYCDKLDVSNLRDYGIGQVLVGGFYQRAESVPLRGPDAPLWFDAVDALQKALRIKPDLTLAKADLGMAYLVHPEGRQAGIGEAARLMQEAADAAPNDPTLRDDPLAYAALLVNLGVANLAAGRTREGLAQLDQGEQKARALAGGAGGRRANAALASTLLYNRAAQLAAAKDRPAREQALGMFEKYLRTTSPLSLWWPLAYDRYAELCQALGQPAKPKDKLQSDRPAGVRPVTGVTLASGIEVQLDEDTEDVVRRLGKGKQATVVPGTTLKRLRYDAHHVELLVTDRVVAIRLPDPESPPVPLRGSGLGAPAAAALRVGMPSDEVVRLLGSDVDFGEMAAADVYYRYYRDAGVAVRLSKGKVAELVVAPAPHARSR
jgi:hypothetical protein